VPKLERAFLDTDILIYALDGRDVQKQQKARALFAEMAKQDEAVISTQVLQEFYVVTTHKLGVDSVAVRNLLREFARLDVAQVDFELIQEAIDISVLNQLSFWDSLIFATAKEMGCGRVYTASLPAGQVIAGVEVINPFTEASAQD
jgi:predicted nucleic acid-binding protein